MRDFRYGLPQGCRLSPLLFNVFLSDILDDSVLVNGIEAGIYADDIRISAYGETAEEAAQKLSAILGSVARWAVKNRVRFDLDRKKCGYMCFAKQPQPDASVTFGTRALKRITTPHKYLGVWFTERLSFRDHIKRVKGKAWRALHEIRRVAGEKTGATLPVFLRLYTALVRPLMEYASSIWDCEKQSYKYELDAIQRGALLSATGALHTTGSDSLHVYCSIQTLADRREMATIMTLERASRLDSSHPLSVSYYDWRRRGSPASTFSVFVRASTASSVLHRFSHYRTGGDLYAEPLPTRHRPKHAAKPRVRLPDKQIAKAQHVDLARRLTHHADALSIYTDGSASPNPGRTAFAVVLQSQTVNKTIAEQIGIGSNITAELCGLRCALKEAVAHAALFAHVLIFCDCSVAVDLAEGRLEPAFHFDIVSDIRALASEARARVRLDIQWVPAHVGVPGNETANDAAKATATSMDSTTPTPGQPKIPLGVTKAVSVNAQRERWQRRWIMTSHHRFDEHLFRLKSGVARAPAFFVGRRAEQTLLARLRFGRSNLAAHRERWSRESGLCECGADRETVHHFLLACARYTSARADLSSTVADICDHELTEELLLGTGGQINLEQRTVISSALAVYVKQTQREI